MRYQTNRLKLTKRMVMLLTILSFVGFLYFTLTVVNIGVSMKYEVDQSKTVSKIKGVDDFKSIADLEEKLNGEIVAAKRNAAITALLSVIFFSTYAAISIFDRKKSTSQP